MRVERIQEAGVSQLGESPLWSVREQKLYWVDIDGRRMQRFDPASRQVNRWDVGDLCCAPAERVAGGFLVALSRKLVFFDPNTGKTSTLIDIPEHEPPKNRFNDATTDAAGRFWIGTMSPHGEPASASLYSFEQDKGFEKVETGFFTINGLAFSPDSKTMYLSDTRQSVRSIWRFDYDLDSGTPSNRELFVDTATMAGRPDGGAVDSQGFYWMAAIGGGEAVRFAPTGDHDATISLPIKSITKIAFGGPNLGVIYATTGQKKDESEDPEYPSGSLLAIYESGYVGVPLPPFAG
jgi:L-arabinonolactonase